jgi:flagellar motor switch protein FliN
MSNSETLARAELPDLTAGAGPGPAGDLDLLADVELTVTVELGRVRLPLRELLRLQEGSVVELDRLAGTPVDVLANGTPVARGDVVVVGDELGVRISELLGRAGA